MNEIWETDLTEERKTELLQKVADKIIQRKLQVPAILMLEMHKPFANVAASASVVFSPFLVPFIGLENMKEYSLLFAERSAWDRLTLMLEESSKESSKELSA